MRVLWLSNTPAAGDEYVGSNGTGGWLKSLDKSIQDKIELHVVFRGYNYPQEFKVRNTYYHCVTPNQPDFLISRIKFWIQRLIGKHTERDRILAIVKKIQPEIIHIHGTETSWIQIVEHIQNTPILLSVQAILTVMTHKYYCGIQKNDLPMFSSYKKDYGYYRKRASDERKFIRHIHYLLGRTDWDRRVYSILAPHAKYYVINEVLREGFYQVHWQEHHRKDGKLIIHTTTGIHIFKGLETICEAIYELVNLGINLEWRIAGVPEDCCFVRIIKHKLGKRYPKEGLQMLGSLNEESLIKKMLEADMYVSPSHQDNSPNALCEATLLGMPCISTYAGGSGTIVNDGVTGILVQDGDPWAMAGAVLEMANKRDMAINYGMAARRTALARHNKEIITDNLIKIYHDLTLKR